MSRLYVWTDLWGQPQLVGAIEVQGVAGEFRYSPGYLSCGRPALDPKNLPLTETPATTHANKGVFGVLADAGPDTWGKRVLANLHPKRMSTATPLDVLALSGGGGTGALLFSQSRDSVKPRIVPPTPAQLGAAAEGMHAVEQGLPLRAQVKELMQAGTSLGGVNPKIAVASDAGAWIAKFRAPDDVADSPRIETACLELARECGINAVKATHTAIAQRSCILIERFDRGPRGFAQHYASAHAIWNRDRINPQRDATTWYSYMGIADMIREHMSVSAKEDCEELFRRMALNVIIGNTDDHGKNHGFVMDPKGRWRLAPAFDLAPPIVAQAAQHSIGIGEQGEVRSIENAISMSTKFVATPTRGRHLFLEVATVVAKRYRALLAKHDVSNVDRDLAQARVMLPDEVPLN